MNASLIIAGLLSIAAGVMWSVLTIAAHRQKIDDFKLPLVWYGPFCTFIGVYMLTWGFMYG